MITEFGWNPGGMADAAAKADCGNPPDPAPDIPFSQHDPWPPASATMACGAGNGVEHRFEDDIQRFFNPTTGELHNTEVLAVWIARGFTDRADGITVDGAIHPWLQNYRDFTP